MKKNILFLILFLIISLNSQSQIIYVKQDATGLNDGTNWENAYTDLSTAINSSQSGQIWVTEGLYFPSTDLDAEIPTDPKLKTFKLKLNMGNCPCLTPANKPNAYVPQSQVGLTETQVEKKNKKKKDRRKNIDAMKALSKTQKRDRAL